jgi:hypothetical protein
MCSYGALDVLLLWLGSKPSVIDKKMLHNFVSVLQNFLFDYGRGCGKLERLSRTSFLKLSSPIFVSNFSGAPCSEQL